MTTTHGLPSHNMGNSLRILQETMSPSRTPLHASNLASFHEASMNILSHSPHLASFLHLYRNINHHLESFTCQSTSSCEQGLLSQMHLIYKELDIHIENCALNVWKNGQLTNVDVLLTTETSSKDAAHVLAS